MYQNKKKKMTFQLKKRNKVFLFTKNLKIKKSNKKLNHVKVEPFLIKNQKSKINYKLELFKNTRVYSIFYISLLKLIDFNTFIQENFHYHSKKKKNSKSKKF